MTRPELFELICRKRSFLCVGLDPEISKIPESIKDTEDPVFEFNRQIIDATIDLAVAYKPNLAFYEANGIRGWQSLEKTINYLHQCNERVFIIADAKRGDIGNTSLNYARAFFQAGSGLDADAVTVAPYMGEDSVSPFLSFPGKWVILLALTSNKGASDFQYLEVYDKEEENRTSLFEKVIKVSARWGTCDNMMYVVGATQAHMLGSIRKIIPDHFLLVPGVGAQGGSLEDVAGHGMNSQCGLLVNVSRSILYASAESDFAERSRQEAKKIQNQMEALMIRHALIQK